MENVHRLLRRLRNRRRRRQPIFRRLINPLQTLPETDVFDRFRFRPQTILFILGLIQNSLERPIGRSRALPPIIQLLCALRFFATGAFFSCIGDTLGISKSSVRRAVGNVSAALCRIGRDWVVFPVGQALAATQRAFLDTAGFPNVAGCVDGTFVKIQAPRDDEQDYINRKGYHSLNCQGFKSDQQLRSFTDEMTCDAKFRITSCVAKWPGSCHDARMFRDSNLNNKFENGHYKGLLLGDSAYPTRRFLMTPYNNPATPQQQRFNTALCKTRVKIEQTYGVLKRRFACLHSGLRLNPNSSDEIITACVVLHNIGIEQNDIINIDFENIVNVGDQPINVNGVNDGNATRDYICRTFF